MRPAVLSPVVVVHRNIVMQILTESLYFSMYCKILSYVCKQTERERERATNPHHSHSQSICHKFAKCHPNNTEMLTIQKRYWNSSGCR